MFFYSQNDPSTWGANLPGSPILAVSDDHEHLTMFANRRTTLVRPNGSPLARTVQMQQIQKGREK
jgi:hypothetical protein